MQKQKILFWSMFVFFYSFSCFASEISYTDTAQNFGDYISKVAFGDLDGDGDLDIFVNHFDYRPNKVWLNDGSGYFSDSGQSLGSAYSVGIDLADLDGDGHLDAFVGNFFMFDNQNEVWLNDGSGNFSDTGQRLGNQWTTGVALGDLDGDGDVDAFVANASSDEIWLNDGSGNFSDSGQRLGPTPSNEVRLGDLDGDGDLDAFVVNVQYSPNKIWLNDGSGNFIDSGQNLGAESSTDVALGDLDGDGDLDAFVANYDPAPNFVWLNDGSGNFSDSGQRLGNSQSEAVALGDLDNDGDLDAVVVNVDRSNEIWLNDGNSNFTLSSHNNIGIGSSMACARIEHLDDTGGPERLLSTTGRQTAGAMAQQDNRYPDLLLSTEGGISIFLASLDEQGCVTNEDCGAGYECVNGSCEIIDNPPALGDGPFVAAGAWPLLSASSESPSVLKQNSGVLWTFSDDYAACSGACTHVAEYQAVGESTWTALTVSTDPTGEWYVTVDLPIDQLQNATTYAFRFAVTDCASQTTESNTYYFRVATSDAPPVIGDGPLLTDRWQVMPTSQSKAPVLNQNTGVLWAFSDDYASCVGLCTHRARYKRVDAVDWIWIPVSTDPTGEWYAYATLPVESLEAGTYQFHFDVRDCAGQRTYAPKVYYFKVE